MSDKGYWKRPLTLAQLLEELEKDDVVDFPEQILIFPPENANDDCDTDEDSGDEDLVVPDNLPGAQLSAEVEVQSSENNSQDWDSDDNKPLSTFVERRPKVLKNFEYESSDLEITTFSDWKDVSSVQNNLSPAATFKLFFDQEEVRPHSDVKTSDNRTDGDRSIPSPVRRFTEIEQHSTYDNKSPQTSGEEVEADVREEVEADVREEDVGEDVNDVDKTDESGDEGTSSTADRKNVPEHQARGPGRPRIVRAGRKGRPKKVFRPAPAEADPKGLNGGSGMPSYWNQSEPTSHKCRCVAQQKYNGTEGLLQENARRMVALLVLNYHVFRQ
ncbi:hypothetical protein MTP99_005924 [Tenebrio molitor]|nr:hypothetical protein MTP99_005924 [Tenebrio molitor]